MKVLHSFLPLFILTFILTLQACNNGGGPDSKKTSKRTSTTDIPTTTKSKQALAYFKEGLAAIDLNDLKKARQLFNKSIEQDSAFGLAYFMRAGTSPSAKEFAEYVNKGKTHISNASPWEKMYSELMDTYITGERKKSIEVVQKIAATYPDAARAQRDLGNAYWGNNQFKQAREAYEKAIQLDPSWVGGYSGLTYLNFLIEPKDFKKAEANALKIVSLAPESAGAQITLGDVYQAQKDFEKAKSAYAKAIQLNPDEPVPYYALGYISSNLDNMDEARKNYAAAGTRDATKTWSDLMYATTYLYAGDASAAIGYLMDKMTKMNADNSSKDLATYKNAVINSVGTIAFHTNNAPVLKKVLPTIATTANGISKDLGDKAENKIFAKANALHWQAMLAILQGKYDEAKAKEEAQRKTLEPIKDDRKLEGYHMDMGMISLKQKKYEDAISHLEKADTNFVYTKYLKAKAFEASGNKEKAMIMYKEATDFNYPSIEGALVRNEVKKKLGQNIKSFE